MFDGAQHMVGGNMIIQSKPVKQTLLQRQSIAQHNHFFESALGRYRKKVGCCGVGLLLIHFIFDESGGAVDAARKSPSTILDLPTTTEPTSPVLTMYCRRLIERSQSRA
jgi:hypothetical protein